MQAMIIAHNKEDREFLSYVVRHAGLSVATSMDIDKIIVRLNQRSVDLILISSSTNAHLLAAVKNVRMITQTPLIVFAERPTEDEECDLLDAGVELVFRRPFSPRLLSRYIKMLLRRAGTIPTTVLQTIETEGIELDPTTRTVIVNKQPPKRLTQLEFRLLYVFMTNPGQIFPTEELVERVWGYEGEGSRDLVRGLIRRLRRKIEPFPNKPRFIHNLSGVGYHFSPPQSDEREET